MFLISNKLEQLKFKYEKKILGFRNIQEKLEKLVSGWKCLVFESVFFDWFRRQNALFLGNI